MISIHALREEGDIVAKVGGGDKILFLSTPSARRATPVCRAAQQRHRHFYPRPPRGGRLLGCGLDAVHSDFYPRPPRGGRLNYESTHRDGIFISIHALREEGDAFPYHCETLLGEFLSTPSARRATVRHSQDMLDAAISIHALREEGDLWSRPLGTAAQGFLSTPSARRATSLPSHQKGV